jgi:CTP synthase (UTP-ammonia lyase)
VIEGIEAPACSFCLGVQWHPENFWETGEFTPLFDAFVAAARTRVKSATVENDDGLDVGRVGEQIERS